MQNVSKANTRLERVLKNKKISEDGKQWLIAALDPFHDGKIRCEGYPDRSSGCSVVQVVRGSHTVTLPATLPPNANWNAAFVMDRDMVDQLYNLCNRERTILTETGSTLAMPLGGLTYVCTTQADTDLFATALHNSAVGYVGLHDDYQQSRYRVLGMGFEVANTTADIYKQGAVVVWEQPAVGNAAQTYQIIPQTDNFYPVPVSRATDTRPPASIAQALLLSGAQQWAAAEGCYCVSTMSDMANPAKYVDNIGRVMVDHEGSSVTTQNGTVWTTLTNPTDHTVSPPGGEYKVRTDAHHMLTPWNMKGAYFTGLSPQTSLVVNAVYIIEVFPTSTSNLVTLATPSPCLDPLAVEIYSHVVCKLPAGVRFADNGLGDFFLGIVDTIADVVTTVGRPLLAVAEGYQQARAAASPKGKAAAKGRSGSTWNTDGKTKALLQKKN